MNAEFCLKVADAVERSETYDQSIFVDWGVAQNGQVCNTPACVAGHAAYLLDGDAVYAESYDHYKRARALMGLDEEQAKDLFQPWPFVLGEHPDGKQAAEVIRHMVRTGEVDWGWVR